MKWLSVTTKLTTMGFIIKKSLTYLYGKGLFSRPFFCIKVNNYRNLRMTRSVVENGGVCVSGLDRFWDLMRG